jgi:hypothetical protein
MRPVHVDIEVRGRREVKAHDAFPQFRMETRRHRTFTQPPLALLTSLERLDSITGLGLALSLSLWLPRLPLRDWEGILEHTC